MYDATNTQGTHAEMVYTCPHCQGRFDFNAESALRQIFCPLCGKSFDPVKLETMRYPEGTPVSPSPIDGAATIPQPNKEEKLPIGARLGQYRIDEFIGRGGMGAVYRATQTSLDRPIALKVLPRHMAEDPEFVQRFHREARALAELNHPNIVSIYDKGLDDGKYFFAMELVDGVSLRQLIKSKKATPAEALALVPQLCEALEYAHARGVIHRDIKPENILVDKSGRVKIADFGLARIIRGDNATSFDGLTRSDVMMGTVNYMAPEQRENAKDVDHRADIYSLGVVIYELLTGELPIGRFAAPSKKVQVDVRIDEMVMQLLEKDPEARYQRASDVRTHLARVMSEPAMPGAPRPFSSLPLWVRGVLGLTGTVFAAGGIYFAAQENPAAGVLGGLFGLAFLVASFLLDHGVPAVGERVPMSALLPGWLFLGLTVFVVSGLGVEALAAPATFEPFWAHTFLWFFLGTAMCAFVAFEGLSASIKARPRGRWAGTIVNVVNLAVLLAMFAALAADGTGIKNQEHAAQFMVGYPLLAAIVFGVGWRLSRGVAPTVRAHQAPRDARPGVTTTLSMILGAGLLVVGGANVAYWCVRQAMEPQDGYFYTFGDMYSFTAGFCGFGYLFLLPRLRTSKGGALQAWAFLAGGALVAAAGVLIEGMTSGPKLTGDMASLRLLVNTVLPCALAVAYAVFWVIARHADGPQAESAISSERLADSRSVRLFQAATGLWIVEAVLTIATHGNTLELSWLFGVLGAALAAAALHSVSRIGRAEDDRVGTRYALGAIAAAVVFPIALMADSADWTASYRYMDVAFCSGWIFVAFAVLDAALRPSRRLGRYFGLGGANERKTWLAAIVGTALLGGMAIAYDYHGVNSGRDVLVGMIPFAGTIAYTFLVVWGVPLSKVMATGSACPVLDRPVQIEANCPSGAGVSITLGASAPPVPSTPSSSVPPVVAAPAAVTVPVAPPAPVVATIPAPGWAPPGIPEIPSPATPVASVPDKVARKGRRSLKKQWREAIWHAGVFLILKFALFGGLDEWAFWTVIWGMVVAAHLVMTLFQTIIDPPHRPAATPAAQKQRKELMGLLQHATWFAAITGAFTFPNGDFPFWGWMWGIGLAFHALSTIMDLGFGKEGA